MFGCVDTRKARKAIDAWVRKSRVLYWLDLGNSAPTGQFVLGQPDNRLNRKKRCRLLTVAELCPEIIALDENDDGQSSCSAGEALTRQEPFINQNLGVSGAGDVDATIAPWLVVLPGRVLQFSNGQVVSLRSQ